MQPLTTNNVASWPGCEKITPEVIQFKKEYLGPENETATGPNFVHPYKITLDVATGQHIGKPLTVKDCIPDGMAYQGNPSVTSPYWPPPPHIQIEPPNSSCLEVSWINIAALGGLGTDATVQFDFSVANQYANGNLVLDDSCKPVLLDNPLSVSAPWTPLDPPRPHHSRHRQHRTGPSALGQVPAIQKSVKVDQEFLGGGAGPTPGDLLQYTLNFQVSDYKTIGQIKITDLLSNGQVFQTTPAPSLKVGDQFGTYTISMLPYYTSAQDPSGEVQGLPHHWRKRLVLRRLRCVVGGSTKQPTAAGRHPHRRLRGDADVHDSGNRDADLLCEDSGHLHQYAARGAERRQGRPVMQCGGH